MTLRLCSVSVPLWGSGTKHIGSMGSLNLTTPTLAGRLLERNGARARKRWKFLWLYPWMSRRIPVTPRCRSRRISSGPLSKTCPSRVCSGPYDSQWWLRELYPSSGRLYLWYSDGRSPKGWCPKPGEVGREPPPCGGWNNATKAVQRWMVWPICRGLQNTYLSLFYNSFRNFFYLCPVISVPSRIYFW